MKYLPTSLAIYSTNSISVLVLLLLFNFIGKNSKNVLPQTCLPVLLYHYELYVIIK